MFQITRNIWLGPFATDRLLTTLRFNGISHIVNVCGTSNQLNESDGPFENVAWLPVQDGKTIPKDVAVNCLNKLHQYVCVAESNVYIHCGAGIHRSPTVIWLYLLSCGIDPVEANRLITDSSPKAKPMDPNLITWQLVEEMKMLGRDSFQPHPRKSALAPPS